VLVKVKFVGAVSPIAAGALNPITTLAAAAFGTIVTGSPEYRLVGRRTAGLWR